MGIAVRENRFQIPAGTALSRVHPSVKLVCALGFIISVVTTPSSAAMRFMAFLLPILLFLPLAGVDIVRLFKRSVIVVPFIALVAFSTALSAAIYGGAGSVAIRVGSLAVKAWLAAFAVGILGATTEFPDMVRGMRGLGMPQDMALTASFLYRYIPVLWEEAARMKTAYDMRAGAMGQILKLKTLGYLVGNLFLRTWERSERVWNAMVARGFTGDWPSESMEKEGLRPTPLDWLYAGLFFLGLMVIRVVALKA